MASGRGQGEEGRGKRVVRRLHGSLPAEITRGARCGKYRMERPVSFTRVLLVDTESTHAWVTTVAKGGSASRLNFLSASVCVDLAEKLFRQSFSQQSTVRPRKILIICPYAPHAKLLRMLIEHQGLNGYVEAGTIHSFQGSEADVVIFDLVNDEPHWKVNLFNPAEDIDNRRLINVAITRAKHRLFVVGDFNYCEKLSRKAFLGRSLIPFLRTHFPMVNALDVIPSGLAGRAVAFQQHIVGGQIEPASKRLVVTQSDFYQLFCTDLTNAKQRVVIYSPFITQDRLGVLEPHIKAAVERGVAVTVVTKPHMERGSDQRTYRFLEQTLADWGITVIHKLRMHEKLVFIDDSLLWSGSLNPLSFSNTQEIMERRDSPEIVKDYSEKLLTGDLLRSCEAGELRCPVCGSEMIAAEGKDVAIFLRCVVDGCFSKDIDKPMPQNGVLTCANCGGAVKLGEWGDKYVWRCSQNPRHHMNIHRHHLKLPKMLDLVPKRCHRALERQIGSFAVEPQKQLPLFQDQLFVQDKLF